MTVSQSPSAALPSITPAKIPLLIPRRKKADEVPSEPPPDTPNLPPLPDISKLSFIKPTRRILSEADHALFLNSSTYTLILAFVFGLSDSVRGKSVTLVSLEPQSPATDTVLSILDEAQDLISTYPPEDTGSRFGNPAFRSYFSGIEKNLERWHAKLSLPQASVEEVGTYFHESFGSASRIDYGSGHELNFMLWLLCLNRMGLFSAQEFPALALVVIPRYLKLMRLVQSTYYLEPAGSHGVWGLDDYQFLPFLIGASQLNGHKYITPKAVHNPSYHRGMPTRLPLPGSDCVCEQCKECRGLALAQSDARRHICCKELAED